MNQSLAEPDYLTCSLTLSAPLKSLPRKKRTPTIANKRLSQRGRFKVQPMAARINHFNPAAEGIRRPDIGQGDRRAAALQQLQLGRAQYDSNDVRAGGQEVEANMAIFNPSLLPDPPLWIARFISSQLKTLPFSTEDDALLAWVRSLKEPFLKAARAVKPKSSLAERKKKMTNAERFRLQLPPVAPKAMRERANKPAPFRIPGIEYSEEEIAAMGWEDDKKKMYGVDESVLKDSRVWLSVLLAAMESRKTAEAIRKDVLEAIWQLLDFVAEAQEANINALSKSKGEAGKAQGNAPIRKQQAAALPKPILPAPAGVKAGLPPVKNIEGIRGIAPGAKAIPGNGPLVKGQPQLLLNRQRAQAVLSGQKDEVSMGKAQQVPESDDQKEQGPTDPDAKSRKASEQPVKPDDRAPTVQKAQKQPGQLHAAMITGLRAMLDAKEKELLDLRVQIDALGRQWKQDVIHVQVGSSPTDLLNDKAAGEAPFASEQASLDPFEEHIRLAKAKQAEENEKKVQPELSILESEDMFAGAAAINNQGKRVGGVQFVKPGPRG